MNEIKWKLKLININLSGKRKDLPWHNLRQSLKGISRLFITETWKYSQMWQGSIMQISRSVQSIVAQLSLMFIYKTFIKIVVVKFATRDNL